MTVAVEATDRSDAIRSGSGDRHFGGFESLRAVAATMVLVHHAGSLAGGRVGGLSDLVAVFDGGVAVFFVLSGFLLYRPMVRRSIDGQSQQRAAGFWWRRVLRIVPAYWLALSILWAAGAFDLGREWWRYYAFLQIYRVDTVLGGIVPAWSLCTELAFYLFLPMFARAVASVAARVERPRRPTVHLVACGGLWGAGFVFRRLFDTVWVEHRGLAFNWLPTNLDLFAAGMGVATLSVALAADTSVRRRADALATPVWPWWSAAGLLFAWYAFRVGPTTLEAGYQGWYWQQRQLVLATFTILVLVPMVFGAQDRGLARRVWSARWLVWVGTVSYGLYLWHLDLMEMTVENGWFRMIRTPVGAIWRAPTSFLDTTWYPRVDQYVNVAVLGGVGLIVGLACAAISWYGLERPLQRFRTAVPRRDPVAR